MTIQTIAETPRNTIFQGDCIATMRRFERGSVDFILTDPPYITHYRGRDGRTVTNDDNSRWLRPAFNQMHRVLKPGGFCVSFCCRLCCFLRRHWPVAPQPLSRPRSPTTMRRPPPSPPIPRRR